MKRHQQFAEERAAEEAAQAVWYCLAFTFPWYLLSFHKLVELQKGPGPRRRTRGAAAAVKA